MTKELIIFILWVVVGLTHLIPKEPISKLSYALLWIAYLMAYTLLYLT